MSLKKYLLAEASIYDYKEARTKISPTEVSYNNGDPKVVFHGTDNEFESFKHTKDIGFHFSSFGIASKFSTFEIDWEESSEFYGMIPALIKMNNPIPYLPDLENWRSKDFEILFYEADTEFNFSLSILENINQNKKFKEYVGVKNINEDVDGIIYDNEYEGVELLPHEKKIAISYLKMLGINDLNIKESIESRTSYIVFDNKQIIRLPKIEYKIL